MRKETPLDSNSDSSNEMSEDTYSDWRRETPIDVLSTTATGNEEISRNSETISQTDINVNASE